METPKTFLIGVFLFLIPLVSSRNWQENPKPRLEVSNDEHLKSAKIFVGNNSRPEHFRLLDRDETSLLIGARNAVLNVSLSTLEENQRTEWHPSAQDNQICLTKGKEVDDCQNYVRVLVRKSSADYLVCGTNAFKARCRNYTRDASSGKLVMQSEEDGQGMCPHDPNYNGTYAYVDGSLIAGTAADLMGLKPIILRDSKPRRLSRTDALSDPHFLGTFPVGDYVYFFLRETGEETNSGCDRQIYARVARVCRNDLGGPFRESHSFMTFLKARLNCSAPGANPFYFNELQSISGPHEGNYKGVQTTIFYGVFTTAANSIAGSAVCAFSLADIEAVFDGPFQQKQDLRQTHQQDNGRLLGQIWTEVPAFSVPEPRPGKCVEDTRTLTDLAVSFVKRNPLMHRAVPQMYPRPIVTFTSVHARYTAVAVAPQVRSVDEKVYDVVYVGTDDGRVIKTVNFDLQNREASQDTVVIEEIEVVSRQEARARGAIMNLRVAGDQLIVVFKDMIQAMPLHRCGLKHTCRECVALRDPMCAWVDNKCRRLDTTVRNTAWPKSVHGPVQNIELGADDRCPVEIASYPVSENDEEKGSKYCRPCITQCHCPTCYTLNSSGGGKGRKHSNHFTTAMMRSPPRRTEENEVPEYQTSTADLGNVYREETLAIAVVVTLVLSLLAGVAIGYLFSRYRTTAFKESTLSESSDYSYGHRSIGGPNRPADYQTEPIYAPAEYPPAKAINVILNMHRNSLKNHSTPTLDPKSTPLSSAKKVYL